MILPEIGGRIHIGLTRHNNYDFFYRQNVIKPALVGLLGPWISGGVEFNWPQHHRPSHLCPLITRLKSTKTGAARVAQRTRTNEPDERYGRITVRPGKSIIEPKLSSITAHLSFRHFCGGPMSPSKVHEEYQAFFPPDVAYVADHAKRAVSSFPVARNFYYGVDYTPGVTSPGTKTFRYRLRT